MMIDAPTIRSIAFSMGYFAFFTAGVYEKKARAFYWTLAFSCFVGGIALGLEGG